MGIRRCRFCGQSWDNVRAGYTVDLVRGRVIMYCPGPYNNDGVGEPMMGPSDDGQCLGWRSGGLLPEVYVDATV